jgi:O-antigen ligase
MPTKRPTRPAAASPKRSGRGAVRRLALSEKVAICALLALVFLSVIAFGASEIATASLFAGLYAAFLIGLLASCRWARRDLVKLSGAKVQMALFALLLVAVSWSLGPWGPGGAHPVWSYTPKALGALTVDRSALLLNILQLIGLACLFVSARVIGASEARGRWFLRIAVLAIGVYATSALLDHIGVRRTERLTATLLSPNSAATVFGGGVLLAIAATANRLRRQQGLAMLKRGDPEAVAALGVAAVLVVTLLLTASRAGLAATLVGPGPVPGLGSDRSATTPAGRRGPRRPGCCLAVGGSGPAQRKSRDRAARSGRAGRFRREAIFAPHWEAFQSSPWFGFGLGSFPTVNQLVATQENLRMLFDVRAVHNLYLQWLEEGGVAGALAMTALFIVLIWPILRGGLKEGAVGTWARATACAALVFLLHGVTDFALQVPAIQALAALLLGVVGSMTAGVAPSKSADNGRLAWATGLVAGVIVLASISVTAPLLAPRFGGDLTAWPTAPAEALARQIEAGLTVPHQKADALARLNRLSQREVALRPASGAAWLRRSAVQAAQGQDEPSTESLEHSFAVAPLQTSLFMQRTIFAYEHWDRISPSARQSATYQLATEWRRQPNPRRYIAMANGLRNPVGRVGMALKISVLRMQ